MIEINLEDYLHPRFWREREDEIVRRRYPHGGVKACWKAGLNRSENAIRIRAAKLLGSEPVRKRWTPDEVNELTNVYPLEGVAGCKLCLKTRSPKAIRMMAERLGISRVGLV